MDENRYTVLLVEDDADWAKKYIRDAAKFGGIQVVHQIPPRELPDLEKIIAQLNTKAVVLDELLQQNSDASYLGIDALHYLKNAYPHLPLVIITEYPPGPELKKIPQGFVYRKLDLDDEHVQKRHFQELKDAIDSYIEGKDAIDKQFTEVGNIEVDNVTTENIKQIARLHFLMDDAVERIMWFPNKEQKEIQLLEINRTAISTGSVEPFLIQANEQTNIPLLVADVTSKEWEAIEKGEIALPAGWDIKNIESFEREKTLNQE